MKSQNGHRIKHRLGTATATSTTNFTVPESYVHTNTSVRFTARPFASYRQEVSQEMWLFPGDTVDMVIQGS